MNTLKANTNQRNSPWILSMILIAAAASASASTELGTALELAFGESVTVPGSDLSVRFSQVVLDSRCPSDMTCMRTGEIIIRAEWTTQHQGSDVIELALGPDYPGQNVTTVLGHRITLLEVTPDPFGLEPIDTVDYRAALMVEPPRQRVRERQAPGRAKRDGERSCLETAIHVRPRTSSEYEITLAVDYHCSGSVNLSAWVEIDGTRLGLPGAIQGGRRLQMRRAVEVADLATDPVSICSGVEFVVTDAAGTVTREVTFIQDCTGIDGDLPPGIGTP